MDGQAYLHFNLTNMITIWIMALIGITLYGLVRNLGNKQDA